LPRHDPFAAALVSLGRGLFQAARAGATAAQRAKRARERDAERARRAELRSLRAEARRIEKGIAELRGTIALVEFQDALQAITEENARLRQELARRAPEAVADGG
jgi:TolA-binding protein